MPGSSEIRPAEIRPAEISPAENSLAQVPSQLTPQAIILQQQAQTVEAQAAQASQVPTAPQPTATVVLIADRKVMPDHCIELVNNGSFEARGMGWSHEGSRILPVYSAPALTGADVPPSGLAIRLGLTEAITVAGISAVQQRVQLPAERNQITLNFRYFPQYEAPATRGDFQYVDIYHGESGQFLGRALGVQRDDRTWIERDYDLSALAGEAIRIFFMVSNDGEGGNIAMYIDDVSILACRVDKTPRDNLAGLAQTQTQVPRRVTEQPTPVATIAAPRPPDEITNTPRVAFGRVGGLLAVLGIAGAALIVLPIIRRLRT